VSSAPSTADAPALADRVAALEERLARRDDEDAIRDLLATYARRSDAGDADAWIALFTEDARIAVHRPAPAGLGEWRGRDALRALMADPSGHGRLEGRTMHLPALAVLVDATGDDAVAETAACVLARDETGATVVHEASFSTWRFRREDGDWRIAERVRHPLGTPLPATPELHEAA
jgi:uncharacterized protein (TIGR02246 family)